MKRETMIIKDEKTYRYKNAISPPLSQSAIFTFDDYEDLASYVYHENDLVYGYTRGSNPTVRMLEEKLAVLAHGEKCVCVSSGEAAIVLTLLSCLKKGDHLISITGIYSTAKAYIKEYLMEQMGIKVSFIDGKYMDEVQRAIQANTKLIYLETPTSASFELQDIELICKLAKPYGIKVAVDNTYATMLHQKPLLLGADYEIHSLSKYIAGHNDVVAGAIIGSQEAILPIQEKSAVLLGMTMSPFDAWLTLRGLRTLPIRLKEQSKNATVLASMLEKEAGIRRVNHIGLASYEQKELFEKQMADCSGLFSFELITTKQQIRGFLKALTLFKIGISWGGYESMIYISSMNKDYYIQAGEEQKIPVVFRINTGVENVLDLYEDLHSALSYLMD